MKTLGTHYRLRSRLLLPLAGAVVLLFITFAASNYVLHREDLDALISQSRQMLASSWERELSEQTEQLKSQTRRAAAAISASRHSGDLSVEAQTALIRDCFDNLASAPTVRSIGLYDSSGRLRRSLLGDSSSTIESPPVLAWTTSDAESAGGLVLTERSQLVIQTAARMTLDESTDGFLVVSSEVDSVLSQVTQVVRQSLYLVPMDADHHANFEAARLSLQGEVIDADSLRSELMALCIRQIGEHSTSSYEIENEPVEDFAAGTAVFDRYYPMRLPLYGVGERHIAELLLLWDKKPLQAAFRRSLIHSGLACLVVGLLLVGLFAFIVTRIEETISDYQEGVLAATRQRAREHKEHAQALERERAALRDTLAFFRTLIDTIPSPVFAKDSGGHYILFNRAFSEGVLHLPAEEVMGRRVTELNDTLGSDEINEFQRRDQELLASGGSQTYERRLVQPDGSERMYRFFKSVYNNSNGEIGGIVAVMLDVTASHHARLALSEQRDFLRHIIESIPHPFMVIDVESRTVELANAAARNAGELGCGRCSISGEDSTVQCPKAAVECPLAAVMRTAQPATATRNCESDSGELQYMEVSAFPVVDTDGRVSRIIEFSTEVTERRRTEMARSLMSRIAGIFLTDEGLSRQCQEACEAIGDLLELPVVAIERTHFSHSEMELLGARDLSARLQPGVRRPMADAASGQTALHATAEFVSDCNRCEHEGTGPSELVLQSYACVPIRFEDEVIAVLSVGDTRMRRYDDFMVRTLELAADILAQVISRYDAFERVREGRRFVNLILQHIPNPVWVLSAQGKVMMVNDALCRLAGERTDRLIGKQREDFPEGSLMALIGEDDELLRSHRAAMSKEILFTDAYGERRTMIVQRETLDLKSEPSIIVGVVTDITENRRLLEEARHAQSMLSEAQRIAGVGSWTSNVQTGEFSCSEELLALGGLDPAAGPRSSEELSKLIFKDDLEQIETAFAEALDESAAVELEFRFTRPDGAERLVLLHAQLYRDDAGRPHYWIGTVMDVTEQREAEARIELLAQFTEHNPGTVVTFNAEGELLYLNPSGKRTLDRLDLTADSIREVLPDQFDERVSAILCSQATMENVTSRCNGRIFQWTFHPVAGQPVVQGFAIDVTERAQFEATARRLAAAVKQSGNLIYITDHRGVIEYINPQLTVCTGYEASQLMGRTPAIFASGRQSELYEELWKTIMSGQRWSGMLQNRKKSGELYWERKVISPILDEHGTITHFVSVGEDISQEIQTQQKLAETDKLSAIGMLAAGVAHEFKNYLGGVIGNASLALDEIEDDNGIELVTEALNNIIEMGERANEVAMSLLTYSRSKSDDFQPTDLRRVMQNAVGLVVKELRNQSIELVTYYDEVPEVPASAAKIQQVVLNLLINAQQSIGSDGIISVAVLNRPDRIEIKVGDSGCGIKQEHLNRIFDPFYSTKGVWGKSTVTGTGLGLSISQNIAREHGGILAVESIEGIGSTFTLTIPKKCSRSSDGPVVVERKSVRIGLFTIDESLKRKYVCEASSAGHSIYLADTQEDFGNLLESEIEMVVLDARFAAKLELYAVGNLCLRAHVPFAVVKNSASEYQLQEMFGQAQALFAGSPSLEYLIEVMHRDEPAADRPTV